MNRQQRRAKKKPSLSAAHFLNRGHIALKQKQYAAALHNYIQAIELDKNNHNYKLHLCDLLKKISFSQFNPKAKNAVLKCLGAPGLDYQALWKPWLSLLMHDPKMEEFRRLIEKKKVNSKKLQACLVQSYFITGLNTLICFNSDFEAALRTIKQDIDNGAHYPKVFRKALEVYCDHTEYIFCKEPKEEQSYTIDSTIKTLALSKNNISQKVRAQYEKNPYPRWVSCTVIDAPKNNQKPPYDHLIAGCGTGYGTCMTAMKYPEAQITAFDLSLASLSYAKRKANALNLKNITFYQADILNLSLLDQTFNTIECSGVLHHMEDPEDGWRALIQKLKPEGKMNIGLYSELGRTDVIAAQNIIKENKFDITHEGIQAGRQAIINLPDDHPARGVINRRDFYSISSCRDLLFHVQEHRFTISKLQKYLKTLNLKFGGFNVENADTLHKYHQLFPDDKKAINLEYWNIFEEKHPDSFRGMYQFWCYKN